MKAFSLLDLAPIIEGGSARQALLNSRDLAQHAEQQGYKRFWMAEHHNMGGIASAATAVALGYVAAGTETIRVGAAGVMLPNHAPLIIAEQYGTLAALFPGRVDLGLGRAPGTDGKTMRALRRDIMRASNDFPQDVLELMAFFEDGNDQGIQAIPGQGLKVPIWLLGSSLFGAQLAAALGQPYIFASHFAPELLDQALHIYRETFKPSKQHSHPYAAAAVNVFAADSDEEAQTLMNSILMHVATLRRGKPGPLKAPTSNFENEVSSEELVQARYMLRESAVGNEESVRIWLKQFIEKTQVDELVLASHVYDHQSRIKSFGIAAKVLQDLVDNS
jgi:luciferase family oxidoreductase group 1